MPIWSSLSEEGMRKKKTISELFKEHGIDIQALKEFQGMGDIDDFDFIGHGFCFNTVFFKVYKISNSHNDLYFSHYKV